MTLMQLKFVVCHSLPQKQQQIMFPCFPPTFSFAASKCQKHQRESKYVAFPGRQAPECLCNYQRRDLFSAPPPPPSSSSEALLVLRCSYCTFVLLLHSQKFATHIFSTQISDQILFCHLTWSNLIFQVAHTLSSPLPSPASSSPEQRSHSANPSRCQSYHLFLC